MVDLLRALVTPLLDQPEALDIRSKENDGSTVLELRVAPSDMGRLIGRNGRRAQAIRSIMKAKANCTGERITVEIID